MLVCERKREGTCVVRNGVGNLIQRTHPIRPTKPPPARCLTFWISRTRKELTMLHAAEKACVDGFRVGKNNKAQRKRGVSGNNGVKCLFSRNSSANSSRWSISCSLPNSSTSLSTRDAMPQFFFYYLHSPFLQETADQMRQRTKSTSKQGKSRTVYHTMRSPVMIKKKIHLHAPNQP